MGGSRIKPCGRDRKKLLTYREELIRSGQSDALFTWMWMVAACTAGMSLSIFSSSVFALSDASVNASGGWNQLMGADWATNRKWSSRATTGERNTVRR